PRGSPAKALEIAEVRPAAILWLHEVACNAALQCCEFACQCTGSGPRKVVDEMFEHRSGAAGNLDAGCAEMPELGQGQVDDVFPGRCRKDQTQLVGAIVN